MHIGNQIGKIAHKSRADLRIIRPAQTRLFGLSHHAAGATAQNGALQHKERAKSLLKLRPREPRRLLIY